MKEQTIYFQDHRGVIRSMSAVDYEKHRVSQRSNENSGNGVSSPGGEIASETPPIRGVEKRKDPPKAR